MLRPRSRRRVARGRVRAAALVLVMTGAACSSGGDPAASPSGSPSPSGSASSSPSGAAAVPTASPSPTRDPGLLPLGGRGRVVVGSTPTPESRVLAELYAQGLTAAGYTATTTELPDRAALLAALQAQAVQVVPDYVGSLAEALARVQPVPPPPPVAVPDLATTVLRARELAAASGGLVVLEPSPAADAVAFAVTSGFADANGLTALSQLAAVPGPLALGADPACESLSLCRPALEATYGVPLMFVPTALGGVAGAQALLEGRVQVQQFLSTDPTIEVADLVVLTDDRGTQARDNIVPVLAPAVAADPLLVRVLDLVSAALDTAELRGLNVAMTRDGTLPARAATTFLQDEGLVEQP